MVKTADCIYRDNVDVEAVSIGRILVIDEYGAYYDMGEYYQAMYREWGPQDGEEVVSIHSKDLIQW